MNLDQTFGPTADILIGEPPNFSGKQSPIIRLPSCSDSAFRIYGTPKTLTELVIMQTLGKTDFSARPARAAHVIGTR